MIDRPDDEEQRPAKKEIFVPHRNAPGPARLEMACADSSGTVHTDPMFIADRQAIANHVLAYSYLIDEERWDDWFALFSDDIVFQTTTPELGTILVQGKEPLKQLVKDGYFVPVQSLQAVRRHTQGNLHVAEQTATTAKVRAYLLISNVSTTDKLQLLTSGTYNADLAKRDDKWIITRWYIEYDAPLSPTKLPEGFTEEQFRWIPDPTVIMPGTVSDAGVLQGRITVANHPFSMGNLYEKSPEWSWRDIDIIIVDHLTDTASAAAMLPEQCTTYPVPQLPGYSLVKQIWAHYRQSSLGPYDTFMATIPCVIGEELYLYVPFIYVNTDTAMAAGREIGGWPAKYGKIRMDRIGNEYRCSVDRHRERLASVSLHIGGKLFSTPLPADEPVVLPYPFNMTLPLPAPTGKPQPSVAVPTATLKVIPSVAEGNPPALARLIGAPWRLTGDFYSGIGASTVYGQCEADPIYKLPNLKTLGAVFFHGSMTHALKEMKILKDLMEKAPPKSIRVA